MKFLEVVITLAIKEFKMSLGRVVKTLQKKRNQFSSKILANSSMR